MSERGNATTTATAAERIARYKEERRRQLAAQYGTPTSEEKRKSREAAAAAAAAAANSSSSSEGPRTTRTSRLRAAAAASKDSSRPSVAAKVDYGRSSASSTPSTPSSRISSSSRLEKDKSSKRKSNLNRSLASEEVPVDSDDSRSQRRRRRCLPSEVLHQPLKQNSNDEKTKSDTYTTASIISPASSPTVTASSHRTPTNSKRSDLRTHMENARRGVLSPHSDSGRPKTAEPIRKLFASDKERSSHKVSDKEVNARTANKENIVKCSVDSKVVTKREACNDISKKMEELAALAKESLARVEVLANKNKDLTNKNTHFSPSPVKTAHPKPSSILKKKSFEDINNELPHFLPTSTPTASVPVSILKRKVSQEETKSESTIQPVTFSPSVVEPANSYRRQGILKKRRSLDESQVLRHRSCSPDVAAAERDSRSILKNQRRSSLEDICRTRSPDFQLQSILKRKSCRNDEDADHSLNSPQGILKRRSGASSAGSSSTTSHVSIATAVILAAADGAEMVLEPSVDVVKPILKKKSLSEEYTYDGEPPKPILKKKSSTDTDDSEEKPKRPILKTSKSEKRMEETRSRRGFHHSSDSSSEREVKPILKQQHSKEDAPPRHKLTFSAGQQQSIRGSEIVSDPVIRRRTICTAETRAITREKDMDSELRRPRPLSVSELVMSFENNPITANTGAVPKKLSFKRNSERYRTQPITCNEVEASLEFVKNSCAADLLHPTPLINNNSSLLELSTSLKNDSILNGFVSTTSPDSGFCYKMSSDSAFQSLGDGIELEDEKPSPSKTKAEPSKIELQMKAIAEEAKKRRLARGNAEVPKSYGRRNAERSTSNRFMTQPVTVDEVQEASKLNDSEDPADDGPDPANLSLSERIKLFNIKMSEQQKMMMQKREREREAPRRRLSRFQTQPITPDEVESAKCITPPHVALLDTSESDDLTKHKSFEPKGILKSRKEPNSPPKSALKRSETDVYRFARPRSILKQEYSGEVPYDEGISSNESASEEEVGVPHDTSKAEEGLKSDKFSVNVFSAIRGDRYGGLSSTDDGTHTSDGESSGGREVRSIIGRDKRRIKEKPPYESSIWKSKSQSAFIEKNQLKSNAVQRSLTQSNMAIAELQAKLQQSGESDWRKRHHRISNTNEELRNIYNEEHQTKKLLSIKDELDASSQMWRARVEKKDAEKFTVSGRMQEGIKLPTINIPINDDLKRTPELRKFRGRKGVDVISTPNSPIVDGDHSIKRSFSVTGVPQRNSLEIKSKKVAVTRPDDDTFKKFFKSVDQHRSHEKIDISLDDLDSITRDSHTLLVQQKGIQVQRRRLPTKNPIKTLSERIEIQEEYTEIITGAAEREERRLNIEKLKKNSNFATEALAGLASKEDLSSVSLRKPTLLSTYLPYKDLMLLHIKGRRHVQTRLVEPTAKSINRGDNYLLITPRTIYNYIGEFSNVIEQSRAADIANYIQQKKDMGCKSARIVTLSAKDAHTTRRDVQEFWKLLKSEENAIVDAGHPDEDEVYEMQIISTNMIYEFCNDELVPFTEYWGSIPKIDMLQESKIIVFDFGSEMYVWSGKTASMEQKNKAFKLAQELWKEGFNYEECSVCPVTVASVLGSREENQAPLQAASRPEWGLFAKITQHTESILFKEKFLDWPDETRLIRVRTSTPPKTSESSYDIQPCDAKVLFETPPQPDLIVEGTHLGRGLQYFDEEFSRLFEFDTYNVTAWRISENNYEKIDDDSVGQFYNGESYILRWKFRMTVKGRELSGKPSKHLQSGRDRTIYFFWQGANAPRNEQGAAALLTVELDSENAPQIRVTQGHEPAAFLRLFKGGLVVHEGRRGTVRDKKDCRLYIIGGEIEDEVFLTEVPCKAEQLRSRTSFLLVDPTSDSLTIWHGCKSSEQTRKVCKEAAEKVGNNKPAEFLFSGDSVDLKEVEEGFEGRAFKEALRLEREAYLALMDVDGDVEHQVRLFHFSSVSGSFKAAEILCQHRSSFVTPYPVHQVDLYSAHQPALFLLDNGYELWLWQGWWPEREDDDSDSADQTGSGAVRWQLERKAAMQTAIDYWNHKKQTCDEQIPAYLVWAGFEPKEFTNLFPTWVNREDVSELNAKEQKRAETRVYLQRELALLSRTTYPKEELLQRPLPEGVDPRHLEAYLSTDDFVESFSMTKEEFSKLPNWKQTDLKKEKGFF